MLTRPSLKKTAYLALSALLLFSFLAAALPQPAQAAPSVTCSKTYVVKEGERIRRIAKQYDVSVNRLAKANNLIFPYILTTGQSLCIPAKPTTSTSIKWSVVYSKDRLKLDGTGFKKDYAFFIKVREDDTSKWYKIGSARTDDKGKLSASFSVPKDLLKVPALNVCLKDVLNDALICKRAFRQ